MAQNQEAQGLRDGLNPLVIRCLVVMAAVTLSMHLVPLDWIGYQNTWAISFVLALDTMVGTWIHCIGSRYFKSLRYAELASAEDLQRMQMSREEWGTYLRYRIRVRLLSLSMAFAVLGFSYIALSLFYKTCATVFVTTYIMSWTVLVLHNHMIKKVKTPIVPKSSSLDESSTTNGVHSFLQKMGDESHRDLTCPSRSYLPYNIFYNRH